MSGMALATVGKFVSGSKQAAVSKQQTENQSNKFIPSGPTSKAGTAAPVCPPVKKTIKARTEILPDNHKQAADENPAVLFHIRMSSEFHCLGQRRTILDQARNVGVTNRSRKVCNTVINSVRDVLRKLPT